MSWRRQVAEAHLLLLEQQADLARWSIAVLADVHVGKVRLVAVLVIQPLPIEHEYDVAVLLDPTRLTQVGEDWDGRASLLDGTGELRECDDGAAQLARCASS